MPKLDRKTAQKVENSEEWGTGRTLLPEGRYAVRLMKVEERPGRAAPQWSWWLTKPHDEDGKEYGGVLFLNTSLSEKALGRLKQVFHAFGYSFDSDTDEMVGEWVGVYVTQEVQQQGQNAGKTRNEIQYTFEFDPDEWDFDPESVPADQDRNSNADAGGDDSF
jgi:hypothetical protein